MVSVCCISIEPITHTETPDSQITHSHNPNCSSQGGLLSLCESLVTMALLQNGFNILYTQHLLFSVFSTCFMSFLSFFNSIPHSKPRMSMPATSVVNDWKTGWMNYKESNVGVKQIFHPTLSQSHNTPSYTTQNTAALLLTNKYVCWGIQPFNQESATHRDRGQTPECHAGSGCEQCQHILHSALLLHGQQTPVP